VTADQASAVTTCYRHPDRAAALGCSRCERPICLQDAVDAPVGYLCPECARAPKRQVRVARSGAFLLTKALVAINVAVFLLQQVPDLGGAVTRAGVLFGPAVASGEWWRIVTSGFLHGGILHIGFNAYLLWMLGQMLEPEAGTARYAALYAAGLFGGSAGALLLSWDAPTLGASGAVFGLMGAAMVGMRRRGVNPWRSSIGSLVLLNLVFTFAVPSVSIGGHLGGLLGGAAAALPVFQAHLPTRQSRLVVPLLVAAAIGAAAVWLGTAGPFL
jgi:membrane associated rhomboid family serine protease